MWSIKEITEEEYRSDTTSFKLFESDPSYYFAKVTVGSNTYKLAWVSSEVKPDAFYLDKDQLLFIGIDFNIVGINCRYNYISFSVSTLTHFKWFDKIKDGIAIVAETEIILLDTTEKCTLRKCMFFNNLIMGTIVNDTNSILEVNFLSDEREVVSLY